MAETVITFVNEHKDDVYAYEEIQERRALIQTMHNPMKLWFYSEKNILLKEHFGQFPLFWQEIENWEPWKEVHRLYLMAMDKQDRGEQFTIEQLMEEAKEKQKITELTAQDQEQNENQTEGETEKKRKRKERWGTVKKSRWGNADDQNQPTEKEQEGQLETESVKQKKTRWSTGPENPLVSPLSQLTPEQCQELAILQLKVQQVNQKLLTVVEDAKKREQDPNKTPSPPPKYDARGIRINTREVRTRDALNNERQQLLSSIMKLNPMFQGTEFKKEKVSRRVYIPIADHPDCNFIGLIIGPRGNTQKRMEKETRCKIMIRGKGSVKEGSKNRIINFNDDDDDLHVMISGDCDEDVAKAEDMVKKLLTPGDHNEEHKQKQLKELALINGTLREDNYCHICGDQGHRQWECPKRQLNFKTVEVRCSICGDTSHPTSDCRLKNQDPHREAELDQEYLNFMAELNGQEPPKPKIPVAKQMNSPLSSSNGGENILEAQPNNMFPSVDGNNSNSDSGISRSPPPPLESQNNPNIPNEFPHYHAKSRYAPWQLQKMDQQTTTQPSYSLPPPANYSYNYPQYPAQTYSYQQNVPHYDEWQSSPPIPQAQQYGYQQYPQEYYHSQYQQPPPPPTIIQQQQQQQQPYSSYVPYNSYPPHYQYQSSIPPQLYQQQQQQQQEEEQGPIQMDYDPFQSQHPLIQDHDINSSHNSNDVNGLPSLSPNLGSS